MLKNLFQYHLAPILLATTLLAVGINIYGSKKKENFVINHSKIEGEQDRNHGFYANLLSGDQAEIDYLASIQNPDQLTIFGSSEFADVPYASYNFIPDTLGFPVLGIGHAYHQELSILCELLAVYEHLDSSKICIVLSPGWFETNGTNIEAFIEFVRPHFLENIASNPNINNKYKRHIGAYINANYSHINGISNCMSFLRNCYIREDASVVDGFNFVVNDKLMPQLKLKPVDYKVRSFQNLQPKEWKGDFNQIRASLAKAFVDSISNNDLFVYNDYFQTYLLQEDGSIKHGRMSDVNYLNNPEFKDFELLLELLQEKNMQASFVIQPLNPYFYDGLELNVDMIAEIQKRITDLGYPCLNMYVSTQEDYKPGTLKDVMHLGDAGWMSINEFLTKVYYE